MAECDCVGSMIWLPSVFFISFLFYQVAKKKKNK
jgi:hypothetical protein